MSLLANLFSAFAGGGAGLLQPGWFDPGLGGPSLLFGAPFETVHVLCDLLPWLGDGARRAAQDRYGLDRFLADWDELLEEALCTSR